MSDQASTDYVLEQILDKSRAARDGHFGVLSTGEKLAAALVLNQHDWLAKMDYTMAEAIERVGPEWMSRVPEAARLLEHEADLGQELQQNASEEWLAEHRNAIEAYNAQVEAKKRNRGLDIGF